MWMQSTQGTWSLPCYLKKSATQAQPQPSPNASLQSAATPWLYPRRPSRCTAQSWRLCSRKQLMPASVRRRHLHYPQRLWANPPTRQSLTHTWTGQPHGFHIIHQLLRLQSRADPSAGVHSPKEAPAHQRQMPGCHFAKSRLPERPRQKHTLQRRPKAETALGRAPEEAKLPLLHHRRGLHRTGAGAHLCFQCHRTLSSARSN